MTSSIQRTSDANVSPDTISDLPPSAMMPHLLTNRDSVLADGADQRSGATRLACLIGRCGGGTPSGPAGCPVARRLRPRVDFTL